MIYNIIGVYFLKMLIYERRRKEILKYFEWNNDKNKIKI